MWSWAAVPSTTSTTLPRTSSQRYGSCGSVTAMVANGRSRKLRSFCRPFAEFTHIWFPSRLHQTGVTCGPPSGITVASITACLEQDFEIVEVLPFERRGALRKLLDTALCNRLFVLNNQRLLEALYRLHRRHLFECDSEADCQRLYVQAVAR